MYFKICIDVFKSKVKLFSVQQSITQLIMIVIENNGFQTTYCVYLQLNVMIHLLWDIPQGFQCHYYIAGSESLAQGHLCFNCVLHTGKC